MGCGRAEMWLWGMIFAPGWCILFHGTSSPKSLTSFALPGAVTLQSQHRMSRSLPSERLFFWLLTDRHTLLLCGGLYLPQHFLPDFAAHHLLPDQFADKALIRL